MCDYLTVASVFLNFSIFVIQTDNTTAGCRNFQNVKRRLLCSSQLVERNVCSKSRFTSLCVLYILLHGQYSTCCCGRGSGLRFCFILRKIMKNKKSDRGLSVPVTRCEGLQINWKRSCKSDQHFKVQSTC